MQKFLLINILVLLFVGEVCTQNWLTDFEEAKTLATEQDKPIIMVFQGSDWCPSCNKLNKKILRSDEFKSYATENFIMLEVDFPRRKKNRLDKDQQAQNNALAVKYNQSGYVPFVVVLDGTGKVLGTTGYEKTTPEDYIDRLTSFVSTASATTDTSQKSSD